MAALRDISVNAAQAVIISNNGTNLAAWDVAYAAGESLRRVGYLAYPEVGSAAYNELSTVSAVLGGGISSNSQGYGSNVTEPGVSLAADTLAAPAVGVAPPLIGAGAQPQVTAPAPTIHIDYIGLPDVYSEARSGWDAIAWHYTNDVPYYTGYDAEIVRRLGSLLELRA